MRRTSFVLACVVGSAAASAQVNGLIAPGEYSAMLAAQTVGTGFGNNSSELDAAYAGFGADGAFRLGFTGNLEQSGNTLVLFLDVRLGGGVSSTLPGGYGVLGSIGGQRADDWGTDNDGDFGVSPTPGGGSILSPDFNPDYAIEISSSGGQFFVNVIDLTLPNEPHPNRDVYLGSHSVGFSALMGTYPLNGGRVVAAFDNSNTQGVNDFFDVPGDPLSASTGVELELGPEFLALLPGGTPIRMMACISNGGGDYLSNQFLPGLPEGTDNLGAASDPVFGEPLFDARNYASSTVMSIMPSMPANARCQPSDIAFDDGLPLPPFGVQGISGNTGVNEGDYNCFFANFFNGCP